MRQLRKQVAEAKRAYEEVRYPGDLARELLGDRRRLLVFGAWWVAGVSGAIAAMIAVAVFLHRPDSGSKRPGPGPRIVSSRPTVPAPYERTVELIRGVPVSAYVMDVKTGMRQAVDQIALGMDGAVDSPVIKGSMQTVRQITDEIEQTMKPIGERLKPKFE